MGFKTVKYGAIDIGSNAIRLLVATVNTFDDLAPVFKKTSLVRVPIRLGQDVFTKGHISDHNVERMVKTMKSYQNLMDVHEVADYKAYATSAMRDADNGKEVTKVIKKLSGINIEIIDGSHEAAMIAMTDLHDIIDENKVYLYVDVGGGSTEFTLFANGNAVESKSFKIGTVRLLNDMVKSNLWTEAEQWVKKVCEPYDRIELIGSGGNINNIFKNSGKLYGKPLSYFYLASYYEKLQSFTYEERVYHLALNQDRADVIIPACRIYLRAMKWSEAKNIHVPKIGLTDGIIKSIYNSKIQKSSH
ncbi:Ppx/GppA phosphatase family protein [Nonlabens marinus]|uniref:Exopolyphosphatase n=1 Tax=Nonlabens marinus S1-08 TaxID=1454201 RepID=W8VS59_9FLAO|nr:exopolyphosphatase [Nonlabens marinus]BAO56669.1 exopolyphosphatase [Nonlabens marinus S1-08]